MHRTISRSRLLLALGALLLMTALADVSRAEPDHEAFLTKDGIPLKVIVREPSAIYERADKTSPSRPVEQFKFYYVLPGQKGGKDKLTNGFYRIGTAARLNAAVGWLPQDVAVEWSHHQVGSLRRPRVDRDLVFFFKSRDDAEKWYKGDMSIQPISREPESLDGTRLFPLLDVSSFNHNGEKLEVFKLAYLHGAARDSKSISPAKKGNGEVTSTSKRVPLEHSRVSSEILQRDFVMQIVFVMDTTGSMQPWIDAMKRAIATITEELGNDPALRNRCQFALVCYRDQLDSAEKQKQMEYVAKMFCDLKTGRDHKEFRRRLADVREATVDSEDYPEDVLAGIKMAIERVGWEKVASKHIILIGDASAHTSLDSYKNVTKSTIPGLLALAQPTGDNPFEKIQIHGLRIVGHDPSDHKICKEHFDQLTKGRDYPGLHLEYKGEKDAELFVKNLTSRLRQMTQITGQVAAGKFQQVIQAGKKAAPGSDDHKIFGPIMEMLQSVEGGNGGPTFTEGYGVVVDRKGNKALEPQVLVTHGNLSLFNSGLDFTIRAIENAGDPGSRDVQKTVSSLQILATSVNLGEDVTADMPLDKLFSLVLGFPVRNPVFSKTPKTLAAMSAADFDGWVRQVRASQSIVNSHLSSPSIWFFLGEKQGRPQDRHAFIKVADLP